MLPGEMHHQIFCYPGSVARVMNHLYESLCLFLWCKRFGFDLDIIRVSCAVVSEFAVGGLFKRFVCQIVLVDGTSRLLTRLGPKFLTSHTLSTWIAGAEFTLGRPSCTLFALACLKLPVSVM